MRVWYVSYGSNLAAARFGCYLAGGTPVGARRAMPGCRDRRPAVRDLAVTLPWRLRFGGHSQNWGGGVAWLDLDTAGTTHARAWLITAEQFADVVAQENHLPPGSVGVEQGATGGLYGQIVELPAIEAVAAVTFTVATPPAANPPAAAYRATIRAGLVELGLTGAQADVYLDVACR